MIWIWIEDLDFDIQFCVGLLDDIWDESMLEKNLDLDPFSFKPLFEAHAKCNACKIIMCMHVLAR